ncbi:MAG: hypothetical protein HW391_719 [Chloroflexi bacterium]|nr:hypothetical protein [Chloroflexota bacterium]
MARHHAEALGLANELLLSPDPAQGPAERGKRDREEREHFRGREDGERLRSARCPMAADTHAVQEGRDQGEPEETSNCGGDRSMALVVAQARLPVIVGLIVDPRLGEKPTEAVDIRFGQLDSRPLAPDLGECPAQPIFGLVTEVDPGGPAFTALAEARDGEEERRPEPFGEETVGDPVIVQPPATSDPDDSKQAEHEGDLDPHELGRFRREQHLGGHGGDRSGSHEEQPHAEGLVPTLVSLCEEVRPDVEGPQPVGQCRDGQR